MREKREKDRILGLGWLCSAGECGIRRGRDQIPISISISIVSGPEAATNGRDALNGRPWSKCNGWDGRIRSVETVP